MRQLVWIILLTAGPARGHDLWLLPPERPAVGQAAIILAHSGDRFPDSEHAPDPAALAVRRLVKPDAGSADLTADGTKDKSGVLRFTPVAAGVYVLGVETKPKFIELSAEKFNAYLVSDGLPHIYRLRAEEKSLDRPAKERYSKSPKAIVKVGEGPGDPCRPLGLPLEIVPLKDPFAQKAGEALPVRVLFRGKPLADANLGWDWPGGGERPRGTARTDDKGEALIPLGRAGLFTIRLTHMTRPKAADHEWESFWTTLTLHVPK